MILHIDSLLKLRLPINNGAPTKCLPEVSGSSADSRTLSSPTFVQDARYSDSYGWTITHSASGSERIKVSDPDFHLWLDDMLFSYHNDVGKVPRPGGTWAGVIDALSSPEQWSMLERYITSVINKSVIR